ncbi:chaplin [Streptomyces sp. 6N223]|uniref:chaplin n=1 Tax=Streptomyces sp. 6N223 TaxID=3457412 RepID=UPI003FCF1C4F
MNTAKRAAILLVATGAAVSGAAGTASAFGGHGPSGATAKGFAAKSPGLISGNILQIPLDIPIQLSGNSVNIVGFLNSAFGNTAANL